MQRYQILIAQFLAQSEKAEKMMLEIKEEILKKHRDAKVYGDEIVIEVGGDEPCVTSPPSTPQAWPASAAPSS